MTDKWHSCADCGKTLGTYHSLWRHKKSCKSTPRIIENKPDDFISYSTVSQSTIPIVSKQNDGRFIVEKTGKIQSLVDEIVNDGGTKNLDSPVVKKRKLSMDAVEPSFLKRINKPLLHVCRR